MGRLHGDLDFLGVIPVRAPAVVHHRRVHSAARTPGDARAHKLTADDASREE
jgi:hypothetical protein